MTKSLFSDPEKEKQLASLEEIQQFCIEQGLEENDGTYMFHHWESNNWTRAGKKIQKWRSVIMAWKAAGHLPSQDPRRQQRTRYNPDRRNDERRGDPGRRNLPPAPCICCGVPMKYGELGERILACQCKLYDHQTSRANFCEIHGGKCKVCCGCDKVAVQSVLGR